MSDVSVRPARPADAAVVARLVRQFSAEDGYDSPISEDDVRALAFDPCPRFQVLIAERGGAAVGYVLYYRSYDTDHAARGLYLQDVYVVPEARRQGVGRALMAAIARLCVADGGLYLFWNALERNADGRAFYRRIGARQERVVTLSLQQEALRRLADGE